MRVVPVRSPPRVFRSAAPATVAVAARVLQDDWLLWRVLAAVATLLLAAGVVDRARLLIGRVRR